MYTYPPYSLICFLAGAFIALNKIKLDLVWSRFRWEALGVGIATFLVSQFVPCPDWVLCWLKLGHVLVLLANARLLNNWYMKLPCVFRDSSFWVYVIHLPLFLLFGPLIARLPFPCVTLRLGVGLSLTILTAFASYWFVGRYFPKVRKLLNGELRI